MEITLQIFATFALGWIAISLHMIASDHSRLRDIVDDGFYQIIHRLTGL